MRAREFLKPQLDEMLPALAGAAGAAGRGLLAAGGAAGRALAKGASGAATQATKALSNVAARTGTAVSKAVEPMGQAASAAASDVGAATSSGGQIFKTATGTIHKANPLNPNLAGAASKATSPANAVTTPTQTLGQRYAGIIDPNHPLANAPSRLISTPKTSSSGGGSGAIVPVGGNSATPNTSVVPSNNIPDADIGTQSSTGGQTFKTDTGLKHFANKNNPNQNVTPKQAYDQAQASQAQTPKTAPSMGPASAEKQQTTQATQTAQAPAAQQPAGDFQQQLKNLGNLSGTNPAQLQKKSTGFLAGLAKGFKQGVGVNPNQSLARGLGSKALGAVGMGSTAQTVAYAPGSEKVPAPGSTINDPRFGTVKVLPNAPGQKGVHLDTTKTLGHPIYVDPKDLK